MYSEIWVAELEGQEGVGFWRWFSVVDNTEGWGGWENGHWRWGGQETKRPIIRWISHPCGCWCLKVNLSFFLSVFSFSVVVPPSHHWSQKPRVILDSSPPHLHSTKSCCCLFLNKSQTTPFPLLCSFTLVHAVIFSFLDSYVHLPAVDLPPFLTYSHCFFTDHT